MSQCKHLKTFLWETLKPFIGIDKPPFKILGIDNNLYKVKSTSVRLRTFKRSNICVRCGRVGDIICLDIDKKWRSNGKRNPHLNLYNKDPKRGPILITKDHIIPKSLGGSDKLSNMQTMCELCNGKKAAIPNIKDIHRLETKELQDKLRRVVNDHNCKMGKIKRKRKKNKKKGKK